MPSDVLMDFGKYRGQRVVDVETSYLLWCLLECHCLTPALREAMVGVLRDRGVSPSRWDEGFSKRAQRARAAAKGLLPPPACQRCGPGAGIDFAWMEFRDGRKQIRRTCHGCAGQLGFAPLVEPYIGLANAAASPAPILDVLIEADRLGVRLRNDGASVDFLTCEDYHRAPPELRQQLRQCRHTLAGMLPKTEVTAP